MSSKDEPAVQKMTKMAEAIQQGQMPTTDQLDHMLSAVEERALHEAQHGTHLSKTGRQVMEDVEQIVEDTRRIVTEKNARNDLQEMIYHARLAVDELRGNIIKYMLVFIH